MKTRRFIPALGAFFVLVAVAVSACGSSVSGNSVATMAGNPISRQALNHWMYVDAKGQAASSPGSPVIVPNDPPNFTACITAARAEIVSVRKTPVTKLRTQCKQLFTQLSSAVMDFLLKGYWYQAAAHKLGIKLTDAQLQTALVKYKKSQFGTEAKYQTYLKSAGETMADFEWEFRINQLFLKLVARQSTKATPAKIAAYYAAHKSLYGTPERRNLRIVLAKSAAQAQAARTALDHGQSWTVVAKKYSTDLTTKNKGGVLTGVTAGQQDAALSTAAFAAPVNKLLGPVKGQFGYYVIEVTKITPATQESLAASTAVIKQTLTASLQVAAEKAVEAAAKKDWLPKTTCRSGYAMADCKGYKAPKTSSASATATTTS